MLIDPTVKQNTLDHSPVPHGQMLSHWYAFEMGCYNFRGKTIIVGHGKCPLNETEFPNLTNEDLEKRHTLLLGWGG